MVAGGMESMSNVPFIVGRDAPKYGGHMMEVRIILTYQRTKIGSMASSSVVECLLNLFTPQKLQHGPI